MSCYSSTSKARLHSVVLEINGLNTLPLITSPSNTHDQAVTHDNVDYYRALSTVNVLSSCKGMETNWDQIFLRDDWMISFLTALK